VYRLTREVRFAVDLTAEEGRPVAGSNGYAGKPPVSGIGQVYHAIQVTVTGEPDPGDGYLVNIKDVDTAVRERAVPLVKEAVRQVVRAGCDDTGRGHLGGGGLIRDAADALADSFPPHEVVDVSLSLSPLTRLHATPHDRMVRLKHTFEFAASHRLHNPAHDDATNRKVFGKCNNSHGHGHNYQVEVCVAGEPDADGFVVNFYDLERVVDEHVITPLDHKHLNVEVPEFMDATPGRLNPSVEHIAKVCHDRLVGPVADLAAGRGRLEAVTVWETPKTWCEYRAD
jgi:6-pyruvoyltetrahydropterin/6-carboxytetrahydropterin synthase